MPLACYYLCFVCGVECFLVTWWASEAVSHAFSLLRPVSSELGSELGRLR
jgi:hypothetical protein